MVLPYHFVTLDDAQNARRRQLLDRYGQLAQLSMLAPLVAFQLFFGIHYLFSKLKGDRETQPKNGNPKSGLLTIQWRRFQWSLDDQIIQGWGTKREWLCATLWAVWLIVLAVKDTGDDYLHLTRRFGIVAASQLPFHYLLAAKSWSPIQQFTKMSHEELNPYHRLLGRIIIGLLSCHAILYLNFYVQLGLLAKRIRNRDVILGMIAIILIQLISTSALAKIRKRNYRVFFITHVVISATLIPILYFHVEYLRVYIIESALIYAVIIVQRNFSSRATEASMSLVPKTNLIEIALPASRLQAYFPGQHSYISLPMRPAEPFNKLCLNPFTISTISTKDDEIRFYARTLGGRTKALSHVAKSSNGQSAPIIIEGPYGSARSFPCLLDYDGILLVAGGVGATFTLPVYRSILQQLALNPAALRHSHKQIRFIWTVRTLAEAQWGLKQLQNDHKVSPPGFELYVTSDSSSRRDLGRIDEGETESIELQEREQLLEVDSDINSIGTRVNGKTNFVVKTGRPNLSSIVNAVFSNEYSDKVAVLVCGPSGMGATLREVVAKWAKEGKEVFWHAEEFGW